MCQAGPPALHRLPGCTTRSFLTYVTCDPLLTYLQNVSALSHMIIELFGHRDYLRILLAVQRRPLRFGQIQKALGLNPAQVDRALRFLRKGLWIIPRTVRTQKGPILVEYSLGKRGAAFLEAFKVFRADVKRRKAELGPSEVAELQSLSR